MKLFLCEKPSQGRDIAAVLGASRRSEGYLSGGGFCVTWCVGHLLENAPPEAYGDHFKRWRLDDLPIIPTQWLSKVKAGTRRQFAIVRDLLQEADAVIIATDADREGELIAWEILEYCRYRGPVQRLWLSALNEPSIRKALASLRPGRDTFPLYQAALARARADWLVGMNLSRLFTLLAQRVGQSGVLSIGRVQTPTLQLVAQRDLEISAFKPRPYWTVNVTCTAAQNSFTAEWLPPAHCIDDTGHCVQEAPALRVLAQLSRGSNARVSDLTSERIREPPPLPFDLSTLQQTASSSLGFDVQHTLALAQSLYETHKAITYPRSDCRYLPTNMHGEARSIITSLLNADSGLNSGCAELDYQKRSRAWNDANITAHHAIIPTSDVPLRQRLNADEWALYHLIRSAYVAQFLPDHEYDRTRIDLAAGDVALRARGRKVLIAGWRNVFALPGDSAPAAEDEPEPQVLPALPIGSVCTIERAAIHARKTVPPCPFTQGELIKAMKGIARWVSDPALKAKLKDTTGIGTEATRAHIISTLISRGFLRKHGRAVQTTEIAHTLLRAIPAAVADPATTALWEQALDRIASNQLSLDHFVHQQSSWVADIVAQHREQAWAVSGGPGIRPPPVTAQARAKKKQSSARSRVNGSTRRNG